MSQTTGELPQSRVQTTQSRGNVCMNVTASDFTDCLLDVVIREFGKVRHGAKILATLTGASPRTTEKWLARKHAPEGAALLNLMARCEAVDAEMARLKALARGEG